MNKTVWKTILQIMVSFLTAIITALGTVACVGI